MGDRRGAEGLGDILAGFLQRSAGGRQVARDELRAAWDAAVGAELSAMTRVEGLQDGRLRVSVLSSALLMELEGFRKGELLQALRARGRPFESVREITFKAGAPETGADGASE